MKRLAFSAALCAALIGTASGQNVCPKDACVNFKGKEIYIPKDLQGMDLQDTASLWSFHRMCCTDNLAIFWQKGFGSDLSNPPRLEGHDMHVDLNNLSEKLEHFYTFFRDTLQFSKPGSNCDRYRMMVMLNYSLEGTAYGGDYDGVIGGLWVAPNRIQDEKLNCMAHELGHYLGLHHAFNETEEGELATDCIDSDYCDDTPPYDRNIYSLMYAALSEQAALEHRSVSFDEVVTRINCLTGQEFISYNMMDYEVSCSDRFTSEQRDRIRHVLRYSPLIPGPKDVVKTRSLAAKLDLPIVYRK